MLKYAIKIQKLYIKGINNQLLLNKRELSYNFKTDWIKLLFT